MSRSVWCAILIDLLFFVQICDKLTVDGNTTEYFTSSELSLLNIITSATSAICLIALIVAGDRLGHKTMLLIVSSVWFLPSFISLFIPKNMFWLFLVLRSISTPGQAALMVMGPVLLADVFEGASRGFSIMAFTLMPIAATLISSTMSTWMTVAKLSWHFASLVYLFAAIPLLILLLLIMPSSKRPRISAGDIVSFTTAAARDLKDIFSIKTYSLTTIGASLGSLHSSTLRVWLPRTLSAGVAGLSTPEKSAFFGMSAPVVIAVVQGIAFIGSLVGAPFEVWMVQRSHIPLPRFLPLTVTVIQLFSEPLTSIQTSLMPFSFIIAMLVNLLNSLLTGGWITLILQMMLDVLPIRKRVAGLSMFFFISIVLEIIGTVLMGVFSTLFRGSGTDEGSLYWSLTKASYVLSGLSFLGVIPLAAAIIFYSGDRYNAGNNGERTTLLQD